MKNTVTAIGEVLQKRTISINRGVFKTEEGDTCLVNYDQISLNGYSWASCDHVRLAEQPNGISGLEGYRDGRVEFIISPVEISKIISWDDESAEEAAKYEKIKEAYYRGEQKDKRPDERSMNIIMGSFHDPDTDDEYFIYDKYISINKEVGDFCDYFRYSKGTNGEMELQGFRAYKLKWYVSPAILNVDADHELRAEPTQQSQQYEMIKRRDLTELNSIGQNVQTEDKSSEDSNENEERNAPKKKSNKK